MSFTATHSFPLSLDVSLESDVRVERDAAIRLAFTGLAPIRVDRLIERYSSAKRVVAAIERRSVRASDYVCDALTIDAAVRLNQLSDIGARLRFPDEGGVYDRLAAYADHPRWLFTSGRDSDRPAIGIVGSRACSRYGLELARLYGAIAAESGWSVVSGLARGIDGAAHRGAIGEGGHCHAVLGSGIGVVYPREHRRLYDKILSTGGMISSEYPPGTPPEGWRFPTRNRIIAGCSDVLLVVEAGVKGGALITARIALEYGIPVYAVPGDVDRSTSVGANLLIRDGAFPVLGSEDLSEVLGLLGELYNGSENIGRSG